MKQNLFCSYNSGKLPKGCQYCVRGEKLVLFVTGYCPRRCYFCPLSDDKYQKDVIFANERKAAGMKDILIEAKNMAAKGAGITGGDPLARIERTAAFIAALKKKYGRKFHIHLYTSLNLATSTNLERLFRAGLDEIRFHPDLDSKRFWNNLANAQRFKWDIGVEIPLIPTKLKETMELIDFIAGKAEFLNLNELEVADNSHSRLGQMGFVTKDSLSYAVKGSLQMGFTLMRYAKRKNCPFPVHLCTAKLKDAVQLANRIKRESAIVRKAFDTAEENGLLTRGALYLPELMPSAGYRAKLKEGGHVHVIKKLEALLQKIAKKLGLEKPMVFLDHLKPRILVSAEIARKEKKYFKKLGLVPAVVTEYPTADQMEIEVEVL